MNSPSTAGDRAPGRRRAAATGLALLMLWSLAGCGRKEAPRPKPQIIPQQTTDLKVQQRGAEVILSFTYPTTTISGSPLDGVQAVELYEMALEIPKVDLDALRAKAEAETAEGQVGVVVPQRLEDLVVVDPMEFAAAAKLRATLTGPELDGAVAGNLVIGRLQFGALPEKQPVEGDEAPEEPAAEGATEAAAETAPEPEVEKDAAYIYAVRTTSNKGLGSAFSNTVKLVRRETPPPPAAFEVEAGPDGIRLSWEQPAAKGIKLINVYRRDARAHFYSDPLRSVPADAVELLDRDARYGESYIYAVTAVVNDYPKVETALSAEREVDYADRFAPPGPRNIVALAERGSVRLLWDAADAPDVAGYFVERRLEKGDWEALNEEPLKGLELTDRQVLSGRTYSYRVSAIDQLGNRGEPAEVAEARVP